MTSNRGSVVSNSTRRRSRNSRSMIRETFKMRSHSRSRAFEAAEPTSGLLLAFSDTANSDLQLQGVGPLGEPHHLVATGKIGIRPFLRAVSQRNRGMQRPIGIREMGPRQADEIGAAGHED